MIDASANFTGFPAGYSPFAAISDALASQPSAPAVMPQMTPQQLGYGPMHSALAQALSNALQNQMTYPGLLSTPTPQSMGLLSTAITPAHAVNMPTSGTAPALGPNQYYRMNQAFWNLMPNTLGGGNNNNSKFPSVPDVRGRNDRVVYGRNDGGPDRTQSAYGDAGGGLSDYGQRSLADYGGIF